MGSRREDDKWSRDEDYKRRSPVSGRRPRDDRRRSRSPGGDRYPPRPQGRDDRYRRRSPPAVHQANIDRYIPGQEAPMLLVNPLKHPLKWDTQVGFSYFAEWWRKEQEIKEETERQKRGERRPPPRIRGDQETREEREKERDKIQVEYDEYKIKHQAQLGRQFVALHKLDEWFKENYDPEVREPFRKRLAEYRRDVYAQWQNDLEAGLFDEFSLEGIYKSDSNGEGGVVDKEEGEAAAANEFLRVGDLVPLKGGDLRDYAVNQPALLIKTIPSWIGRDQLEAWAKEHLGDGEGGFKWLGLSDPNPTKRFHRIGWVMLNPGGDRTVEVAVKNNRGDGRDEEKQEEEEEEDGAMKMEATETVTKSGLEVAQKELDNKSIENSTNGTFHLHVGEHKPQETPRKKALWDLFSAPERVERDLELALRLVTKLETELGEDMNAVNKVEERLEEIRDKGLLAPRTNGAAAVVKEENGDAEDGEDGEMDEKEEGAFDEEVDDEEMLARKKRLDLLVEYLRRVHSFCFFCVFEADSVHALTSKCPGGHLRRPRASLTNQAKTTAKASAYGEPFPLKKSDTAEVEEDNQEAGSPTQQKRPDRFNRGNKTHKQLLLAFNWVKTYEDKLYQILEPDSVDIKKIGGRPVEEGLEEDLKKFVKQEDESKYRCKVPECTKLFKGENFWRKHVEKRHAEWFEKQKKEIQLINNYVLDPAHISPSTLYEQKPGMQGTYPTGNAAMPAGTPRGFNFATMQAMNQMAYAGMPPPQGFAPNFGQYPVAMPPQMYNPAMMDPSMMMGGQVGPMRRGGGRFGGGGRSQNPYERPAGRAGRPMPGGARGADMRFPDKAGGRAPEAAVMGRQLKSYEDLDGPGAGESVALDY